MRQQSSKNTQNITASIISMVNTSDKAISPKLVLLLILFRS